MIIIWSSVSLEMGRWDKEDSEILQLRIDGYTWRRRDAGQSFHTRPVNSFVFIALHLISWPIYCDRFVSLSPTHLLVAQLYILYAQENLLVSFARGVFLFFFILFLKVLFGYGCFYILWRKWAVSSLFSPIFFLASIGFLRNFWLAIVLADYFKLNVWLSTNWLVGLHECNIDCDDARQLQYISII